MKKAKSLENLIQSKSRISTKVNEIEDRNPNIVRYGTDTFYKTSDGRLIKLKTPFESKSAIYGDDEEFISNENRRNIKKNQVYFADEVAYNGNESLKSIENVRIPSGVVTIVRNSNGNLVYYDKKGDVIDVKTASNKYFSKHDDSLDGAAFLQDSGYNTTINASSRSQRNTPLSHLNHNEDLFVQNTSPLIMATNYNTPAPPSSQPIYRTTAGINLNPHQQLKHPLNVIDQNSHHLKLQPPNKQKQQYQGRYNIPQNKQIIQKNDYQGTFTIPSNKQQHNQGTFTIPSNKQQHQGTFTIPSNKRIIQKDDYQGTYNIPSNKQQHQGTYNIPQNIVAINDYPTTTK